MAKKQSRAERWTKRAETIADAFPINEPAGGDVNQSAQAEPLSAGEMAKCNRKELEAFVAAIRPITAAELRRNKADMEAFVQQLQPGRP
ncbi:MAG: hypothetical protein AABZ34_04500 [Nitrospirota bacterium]